MQTSLADNPAPRMTAAQLLEGRGWRCALHALEDDDFRARRTAARGGGEIGWQRLSCLLRYEHNNAWRGVPRYASPDSIERSFWDLVVLFNIAELLAGGIGQGPCDPKGPLAISRLPQEDKCMHAVSPEGNPARQFNTPAYELLLDGSGERLCAVARRTGDPDH